LKIALPDQPFRYVTENSAECDEQTAFVLTELNRRYLDDATNRGAHSVIAPADVAPLFGLDRIKVIGITGTNGKTTTASAIYSILLDLGYKAALQGTRGFFMNDETVEGKSLTTPTLLSTYRHIYQAVAAGCDYFIMEVSSHAIAQKRAEGIGFSLKILTNITQDHLDYHGTMEEYTRVKNSFFADDSKKLINKDEPKAEFNMKNAYSYGAEHPATYKVMAYSLNEGISVVLQHFQQIHTFHSPMHGFFNVYNLTAAVAAVHLVSGRDLEEVCDAVGGFAGVSGRMEVVSESPLVIVDFAHTPDGMAQVLNALKEKEVLVVFGAGGDRDHGKRPLMGRVAESLAKKVYVTSDNPRNEDPDAIIADILGGMEHPEKAVVLANRKAAIAEALHARAGEEVVVVLGKGDEQYQIIYDQKVPFDDREVIRTLLSDI
jgi:UDP-N-acetylmuramoyl-L-alanyl-D-glutamate--2,6-diaminopimelate ligase